MVMAKHGSVKVDQNREFEDASTSGKLGGISVLSTKGIYSEETLFFGILFL